jgi:hypothetical protein
MKMMPLFTVTVSVKITCSVVASGSLRDSITPPKATEGEQNRSYQPISQLREEKSLFHHTKSFTFRKHLVKYWSADFHGTILRTVQHHNLCPTGGLLVTVLLGLPWPSLTIKTAVSLHINNISMLRANIL